MHKQIPDDLKGDVNFDSMQNALSQLLEQISKRDQKIAWINAENSAVLRVSAEKERAVLAEKEDILLRVRIQLAEREALLNEIVTSRAWKVVLLFRRVRVFLVPPNSRRAWVIRQGLNFIFLPFRIIKRK